MKTLLQSLRLLLALTALTGLAYPALVWAVAQIAFPAQAAGSLARRDDVVVGSSLLAQKTEAPRYVWPRPSAADYATVASGASHLPWTSRKLRERVAAAQAAGLPPALATTSGSGLDPHLPPDDVRAQLDRVAAARNWGPGARALADAWIARNTEGGMLSPHHVNVLRLNLALDDLAPDGAR